MSVVRAVGGLCVAPVDDPPAAIIREALRQVESSRTVGKVVVTR